VWPLRVVVPSPLFDDDLGLLQAVEYLPVQEFIAEPGIEALAIAVLPWRPWFYVSGLRTNCLDPLSNRIGDELRSVVREDVSRNATDDEQVRQGINHIHRVELSLHPDRKTLPAELVDDVQCSISPAVFRSMMYKVIRPDVVGIL
jgi:hypothetical protein